MRPMAKRLGLKEDTLRSYLRCRRQWPLATFYKLVAWSRGYVTLADTVTEWESKRADTNGSVPR
jgi:hypothetical protein